MVWFFGCSDADTKNCPSRGNANGGVDNFLPQRARRAQREGGAVIGER